MIQKPIHKKLAKVFISVIFTILFVCGLIYYQDLSLITFKNAIHQIDHRYLLISFLFFIIANLVRSIRFYQLIGPEALQFRNIFASNNIYNLSTASLPGGLGEGLSVFLFTRYNNIKLTSSFSIILLSRILDLLMMSLLVIVSVFFIQSDNLNVSRSILLNASMLLGLAAIASLLPQTHAIVFKVLNMMSGKGVLGGKIKNILIQIQAGLAMIHDLRTLFLSVLLSFLMMFLNVVILYFMLYSINIHLSFSDITIVFGIYCIMQIVPVHGIAGIGTQEAWWTLALMLAGVQKETAVPASFIIHGIFYFFILITALSMGWVLLKKNIIENSHSRINPI